MVFFEKKNTFSFIIRLVYYRFNVDAVMAPTSHLLVYYTTEKGETINDVISFNVKQTDPKVLTIMA